MTNVLSNLDDMVQSLRDNFKGVKDKDYIRESLDYHFTRSWISKAEYEQLKQEYLGE